jgi:predicted RNA-binding Zn-ribbon protein involved in translation (DUF1610 family)
MYARGMRSTELAKETLMEKCPNCGAQGTVELHLLQNYAHVFWIPFFPAGKTATSECTSCKQVLKLNKMPESFKTEYKNLKGQTKTPLWTFSGIPLLALVLAGAAWHGKQKDAKNAQLILAPKVGDIFEIKEKEDEYTVYKVQDIEGDSVYVYYNQYETSKSTGLDDIINKGDSAYSQDVLPFSKSELKAMLAKGEIMDIDRK